VTRCSSCQTPVIDLHKISAHKRKLEETARTLRELTAENVRQLKELDATVARYGLIEDTSMSYS